MKHIPTFFEYISGVISRLKQMGKIRTAETYTSALNSFRKYRQGRDLSFSDITTTEMQFYEAYLFGRGLAKNTTSFYNRTLRAAYNRAVSEGLVKQCFPFRGVYTGVDKTPKRALPLETVKRLKKLDLSDKPEIERARDLFLFSFYTRGMSFIDMAYLKASDLRQGILTYRRRKTRQQLTVRWEQCMQDIVDKYTPAGSTYLLPIIRKPGSNERSQYQNNSVRNNHLLHTLGRMAGLQHPLTMYVARHSWASAAQFLNIPLSVISESMGHTSLQTTQIYLDSIDLSVIDSANSLILSHLE